jgi:hypothetical protein
MFPLVLSLAVFLSFQAAIAEEHPPETEAKPLPLLAGRYLRGIVAVSRKLSITARERAAASIR